MSERMNTTEIFEGIRFPGFMHTLESLKAACAFQFQDTDVLLVTFPKSGERRGLGQGAQAMQGRDVSVTFHPQGPLHPHRHPRPL